MPEDAADIHGITAAALAGAPAFADILADLTAALRGKRCLIYSSAYGVRRLRRELTLCYLDRAARRCRETVRTGTVPEDIGRSLRWLPGWTP